MRRFSQLGSRVVRELGSVSQKCRNFSGLFWLSQFPLHLRHVEVLGPQTSQSFWFFLHKNMFKDQLFKKTNGSLTTSFWPRSSSGLSRNRPPDLKSADTEFKPRFDHKLDLYMFHVSNRWFNSSAALVHSHQLACLLSVGIFNLFSSFVVLPSI